VVSRRVREGPEPVGRHSLSRWLSRARRPFPGSPGLAVLQIAAGGLVAFVLLAIIGVNALQGVAERQALHLTAEFATAKALTVKPRLTRALLRGDPAALRALDRSVHEVVLSEKVLRVKLWDAGGRIVYSDDHRYIGKTYSLTTEERRALRTGRVSGELSRLTAPDNRYDSWPGVSQVVQVCTRVKGPDGRPMLLQLLVRDDDLAAVSRDAARAELPAFLVAIVALQVLQLPLAVRLVRRVRQGQRERDLLHRHAVEARDHERTRIARDLHDGVVQQLAGVSYSLASVGVGSAGAQPEVPPDVLNVVRSAAATTRDSALELRTLVAELTPPTVYEVGLPRAVEDLAASLQDGGAVRVDLVTEPGFTAHPDVSAVLFRAAQEGLRNVVAHSGASRATVRLERSGRQVRVVVQDDGRGLPQRANGAGHHFGLRLLGQTARELGGRMDVTSGPSGGTTFLFELPDR
jgi:signal transduction histidine kinase